MKNGSKKLIIILVLIVLIVAIGVVAYLFLKTNTFKAPKELFYTYLNSGKEQIESANIIGNLTNNKNVLTGKAYNTKGELTVNYTTTSEEEAELAKIINNMKITVDGKTDEVEEQAYSKFKFLNGDTELFNAEYLKTNDLYAITSNQVVNLYLAVKDNSLNSLLQKSGLTQNIQIPNNLSNYDINANFNSLLNILGKYGNVFVENISDDKYSKYEKIMISINGKNYENANSYTLNLTETELKNALLSVLKNLKEDDAELNNIISLYKYNKNIDDLNNMKSNIQNIINNLEKYNTSDNNTLKIDIYESNNSLIKIQVEAKNIFGQTGTINIIPNVTENEVAISLEFIGTEKFNIEFNDNKSGEKNLNISLSGNRSIKINSKEQEATNGLTRQLIVNYQDNINKVQVKYDEQNVIAQNIKIDKLDSNSNCVILNDYPEEGLKLLVTQIRDRIVDIFNDIQKQTGITTYFENKEKKRQEEFNNQFITTQVENISGENLKSLLNRIIISNNTTDRKVGVRNEDGSIYSQENEINTIINQIQNDTFYNLSFEYSEQGYINLVTIGS